MKFKKLAFFFVIFLIPQILEAAFSRYKTAKKPIVIAPKSTSFYTKDFSLGIHHYRYEEPSVMMISGPMMLAEGGFGGIFGSFKFHIDGVFSTHFGATTYNGSLHNAQNNATTPFTTQSTDWFFTLNNRIGMAFMDRGRQILFLHAGLSYRFLDNFNIDPPRQRVSYRRLQGYLFVPAGVDFETAVSSQYAFTGSLEGRLLIIGHNSSITKRLGHFDGNLHFLQKSGYGARVKIGVKNYGDSGTYTLVGFFDYWSIGTSDVKFRYQNGVKKEPYLEPQNTTHSFGVMLGAEF